MKIDKIDEEGNTVRFVVEGTSPAFMNAIRRVSMNDVPVLAIEDVAIHENDSPLFDELLGQRLGQIPLDFDYEDFTVREECDCEEGCPSCEVKFTLESEGKGTVYSGELESENENVSVLYDNIPITEQDENHVLKLEATAVLSTGSDHSKHQAAVSSYQYYPVIDIDNSKLSKEDAVEAAEVCPQNVYTVEDGELVIENLADCTLCDECVEAVDEGIAVNGDENKFIFKVESISGLDPQDILEIATETVREKAERVIEEME